MGGLSLFRQWLNNPCNSRSSTLKYVINLIVNSKFGHLTSQKAMANDLQQVFHLTFKKFTVVPDRNSSNGCNLIQHPGNGFDIFGHFIFGLKFVKQVTPQNFSNELYK